MFSEASLLRPQRSRMVRSIFRILPLLTIIASISGCGGGGGGSDSTGDFDSSAVVQISSDPSTIDVGDITQITVNISAVNTNGIALKIRFADSLSYVPNTSVLTHNITPTSIEPTVDAKKAHEVYLVYYLSRALFGDSNQGVLTLQLYGASGISNDQIEVDPDVDDPAIPNSVEFNINNPHFEPDDSTQVTVTS